MSVTREDIIWAYRMILGREPENEEVIDFHKKNHSNVFSLRRAFISGQEFLQYRLKEALEFNRKRKIKSIIVNSHRRSGTHFLMDTIVENFPFESQWAERANTTLFDLLNRRRVLKNHIPNRNFPDHSITPALTQSTCKDIFIYRNPYHTLRSMYYFDLNGVEKVFKIGKGTRFIDYLKGQSEHAKYESKISPINRIEYFFFHTEYWLNQKNVLPVRYEDLINNIDNEIKRIGEFIEEDVRVAGSTNIETGIATGITNKDERFWSDEVLSLFSEEPISSHIRALGYRVATSASEI